MNIQDFISFILVIILTISAEFYAIKLLAYNSILLQNESSMFLQDWDQINFGRIVGKEKEKKNYYFLMSSSQISQIKMG